MSLTRTEASGQSRHQVSATEAEEINASRPAGSPKPLLKEGDWVGSVGLIKSFYVAEVTWLSGQQGTETIELQFLGGRSDDLFQVVDGMPLPQPGHEYLFFITKGDGWAAPAYVQFEVTGGRLSEHMHNDAGVGKQLLGSGVDEVARVAAGHTFRGLVR